MGPERSVLLADDMLTGEAWCQAHSALIDGWMGRLLEDAVGPDATGIALAAVGGYGRAELCPGSDIDVMLVHRNRADVASVADRVWYPVWDAGVHLGHSVSTPSEALQLARDDLDSATALLSVRHVAGEPSLTAELAMKARRQWEKHWKRWLGELADSVDARHAKAGEVAFLLEPDLKEGRGGLRDAHALRWAEAAWPGLLEDDNEDLAAAYSVLLDGRVELQRRSGRPTNVLVLEEQAAVAEALGDSDADALMIRIAEAASTIAWTSDEFWRRARTAIRGPLQRLSARAKPIAPGILLDNGEVELDGTGKAVSADEDAVLVLKVAVLAASHEAVIERRTLQRLAKAPPIPEPWPVEARQLLVDLLATGRPAIQVIEALDRRGCWTTILPEWAEVRSRPQHNAYHRFTVDRHLLETVALTAELADRTDRPDLLVMAALLHDLGKGRDRDHTDLGVELAARITSRMGFPAEDVETLVEAVRYHLLLPEVATRRDLNDPASIAMVASKVGSVQRLRLLAALTEADSKATGHGAWGPWKRDLLEQLVADVERLMTGQHLVGAPASRIPSPEQQALLDRPGQIIDAKDDVITVVGDDRPGLFSRIAGVLALHGLDVLAASAYSSEGGRALSEFKVVDQLRDSTPWPRVISDVERALSGRLALNARIAARIRTYERRRPAYTQLAVSAVSFDHGVSPTATVIDVYAPNGIGLLYRITRTLAELDLDIRSAKAATFGVQAVDSFYVVDRRGIKITEQAALAEIEREILHSVTGEVMS